MQYVKHLTRCN